MTLSAQQRDLYQRAAGFVSHEAVAQAAAMLVSIPSPTGEEGPLARSVVSRLQAKGIEASEQPLDARQSNAFAILRGTGAKPSLMLYAPTDTVTSNNAAEDLPWAGPELLPEMRAEARIDGDLVIGLGAQNPKGHAACALIAFEAIRHAGIPLAGDLMLGLGAGGMPTNARPGHRPDSGHGAGCDLMMRTGPKPDYAVIAKSGWAVSWEEVGLAWYDVNVAGTHTYVGSRHLLRYSNAIANAARVVLELEAWFPEWSETNRSGLVAPQGVVSFVESGWERMPAFTPAVCRLRFDLRLSPRTTIAKADAAVGAKLAEIAARHGLTLDWTRIIGIAGTFTDPKNNVIRAAVTAWEFLERRPHKPMIGMSGATDANILRGHGVPTARIGLSKVALPDLSFQRGMNIVSVDDMVRLTRHLIHVAIDMCADIGGEA